MSDLYHPDVRTSSSTRCSRSWPSPPAAPVPGPHEATRADARLHDLDRREARIIRATRSDTGRGRRAEWPGGRSRTSGSGPGVENKRWMTRIDELRQAPAAVRVPILRAAPGSPAGPRPHRDPLGLSSAASLARAPADRPGVGDRHPRPVRRGRAVPFPLQAMGRQDLQVRRTRARGSDVRRLPGPDHRRGRDRVASGSG